MKIIQHCYICNNEVKDDNESYCISQTTTPYTKCRLVDKIAELIGEKYIVVVTEDNRVCESCLDLLKTIDRLEFELEKNRTDLKRKLEINYKLNFQPAVILSTENIEDEKTESYFQCVICSFKTKDSDEFEEHSRSHSPSKYNCIQCLETFNSDQDLKNHIKTHVMFKCRICAYPFPNYFKLKHHLLKCAKSNQYKVYMCSFCNIQYLNRSSLREHMRSKHKKVKRTLQNDDTDFLVQESRTVYNCTICNFETSSDAEMKSHIVTHSNNRHKCTKCKSSFKSAYALEVHARRHIVNAKPVQCNICACQCVDRLHLRRHKKNVHKLHLTCSTCKTICATKMQLHLHIQQVHGIRRFQCEICDLKFTRDLVYKNHVEYAHRSDNKCKFCKKVCNNVRDLRMHERRHKRPRSGDIKCDYCDKHLKTKTGLRVHMARHTGAYKYFCEVCGRGCMSLVVLKEHMGVHTKEERYICDVCGKKFCFNATYRVHRMWHDNPKPYMCNVCGQKFSHTSLLAVHRRKDHTGERPYVCSWCNMTFTRSSSLKRHSRIHTGERPYVCVWCNRGFIEKNTWAKHLANEHNDYTEVNNKPKCEYKMVIQPEKDESLSVDKEIVIDQARNDMQEFIIIGNPNLENMILYGLQSQIVEEKDVEQPTEQNSSTILIQNPNDLDNYEIIESDLQSSVGETGNQQHLLEGVDETSIVIKTDEGDMIIRNGQLVPLATAVL